MKNIFQLSAKSMLLVLLMLSGVLSFATASILPASVDTTEPGKHEKLLKMVNDRSFILEANMLQGHYGQSEPVSPGTNFVSVDGENATIQIAFNNGRLGYNGLGGITLDGRVTRYEVKDKGKKKGVYVSMTVFGAGGTYDLFMNINDSGYGSIDVRTIRGERLQYRGELIPLEMSDAYKGNPVY